MDSKKALILGFAVCAAMIAGCRVSEQHGASADNRIFPPGEGKVVQFDMHSDDDAPVYLVSKNVQAQRDGNAVVVNFDEIDFSRAQKDQRDIRLRKVIVRVYRRGAERGQTPLASSEEKELRDLELSDRHPVGHISSIQVKVPNAAQECNASCLLTAVIDYSVATSKTSALGGFFHAEVSQIASAESQPVRVNLASGTAGEPAAASEASTDAATIAICSPQSHFGPATASRALGIPMKYYGSQEGDCTMVPVNPYETFFSLAVLDDAGYCDVVRQTGTGIETTQLGDRAIWVDSNATLCVQKGDRTVDVQIGAAGQNPVRSLARRKAIDIASKILSEL